MLGTFDHHHQSPPAVQGFKVGAHGHRLGPGQPKDLQKIPAAAANRKHPLDPLEQPGPIRFHRTLPTGYRPVIGRRERGEKLVAHFGGARGWNVAEHLQNFRGSPPLSSVFACFRAVTPSFYPESLRATPAKAASLIASKPRHCPL